ncbi:uncharacterized protein LOC124168386 [Ischnura elegans]|uniref:uncharacterized protein LOC124168386 n=1 Tax=Ischnura elegans TaxID=197161 RepID=UPI001ED8AE7F|nr:uncharacterized protein LOC124168386 [Ischnura elegans]
MAEILHSVLFGGNSKRSTRHPRPAPIGPQSQKTKPTQPINGSVFFLPSGQKAGVEMLSVVLLLLAAHLPSLSAAPQLAEAGWNGRYSVQLDGADVFIDLGDKSSGSMSTKGLLSSGPPSTASAGPEGVVTEPVPEENEKEEVTTWSIAWYLTLLSAFIVFFVFIGLMEVFCRRRGRFSYCCGPDQANRGRVNPRLDSTSSSRLGDPTTAPPPPYELFKPPSYNTLFPSNISAQPEKMPESLVESPPADQLIYVINVHSGRGVS